MMLICGSAQDRLIQELLPMGGAAQEIVHVEESHLFNSCGVAFWRTAETTTGFLTTNGRQIQMQDLDAILLRLPRNWYPIDGFDLQDQMFVYHETIATWFAVLDALHCSVINRFGLGWWLHDLAYPYELRNTLAKTIKVPVAVTKEHEPGCDRLYPTKRIANGSVTSVYRSGGQSFPQIGSSAELEAHLIRHQDALLAWEKDAGITLSRLDFEQGDGLRLQRVEVYPLFEDEQQELTRKVADALLSGVRAASREAA